MNVLIVMDRQNGQHLAAEIILRYKYAGETITTKDLNAVTTGDVSTWIGTLVDDTYDKIEILVNANVTAGTGVISKEQYGLLVEKLDQTTLNAIADPQAEGTCQANATVTEIILAAAQTEADDYFNDMIIVTEGTTVIARLITDYVQSTDTATVTTTTTAITTSETYKIFTVAQLEAAMMPVYAETYEAPEVFAAMYPNCNAPLIIQEMGAMPASPCLTATANSVADTGTVGTLTDTGNFASETLAGYYVAIRSATLGAGQVIKIASHTDDVLTLEDRWDPTPTGTIVYEVVDRKHVALSHYFLEFAFRYLMRDPSWQTKINEFIDIATQGLGITTSDLHLYQDLDALQEFKDIGQHIMRSIGMGITS